MQADTRVRLHALGLLVGGVPSAVSADLAGPAPALAPVPIVTAGLPSDLLRRRPDVRSAERALAASTADNGVAVADFYPRFRLPAVVQPISTSLDSLFERNGLQFTVTLSARFPLVDWRRQAAVKMRHEPHYRQAVLGALRDVEDPLAQLDAERRRNETLRRAVADVEVALAPRRRSIARALPRRTSC